MKVEQKAKQSSTTNTVSNAISSEPSNEAGLIGAVDVGTMIHKLRVEKGISDKIGMVSFIDPDLSSFAFSCDCFLKYALYINV
jgi:hypothetical protein